MILKECLKVFGKKEFAEALAQELSEKSSDLPLEEMMDNGGWLAEDVEVSVSNISDDEDNIYANIEVYFSEDHPSGCADITRTDSYRATMKVSINKHTGDTDFEVDDSENTTDNGRTAEDDEFDVGDLSFDEQADSDYRNSEF